MRVRSLSSNLDGTVRAVLSTGAGEEIEVVFAVDRSGDIPLASPDTPVFDGAPLTAHGVRQIVAAVVAFDRVAGPSGQDGRSAP